MRGKRGVNSAPRQLATGRSPVQPCHCKSGLLRAALDRSRRLTEARELEEIPDRAKQEPNFDMVKTGW